MYLSKYEINILNMLTLRLIGFSFLHVSDAAVLSVTLTDSVFSTLEIALETRVHRHTASAGSVCTAVTVAVCKYIKEKSVK